MTARTQRPGNIAMPLLKGLHRAAAKMAVTKMIERGQWEQVPQGQCCVVITLVRSSAPGLMPEVLGRTAGRQYHRRSMAGRSRWHRALGRHLHDDGQALIMTAIADALGLTLRRASSIPAVDSNHKRMGRISASVASTCRFHKADPLCRMSRLERIQRSSP